MSAIHNEVVSVIHDKVKSTIRHYGMICVRDTVLAAVSGGPDSICMLHVLASLQEELGFELRVAHLDHRFRGDESRRDAEFVKGVAEDLGLPCRCEEENVPQFLLSNSMSKQDAARMLRYKFLITVSKQEYCQRIATGHNADDQAETVLMRVLRGAGPDGLAGIPPKRDGTIIRPLLGLWRSEIEEYLEARGLPYRTDASNLESTYTRNKIRNELLPALEEYNPRISQSLVNLGSIMTGVKDHLEKLTDEALPKVVRSTRLGQFALDSAALTGYDEALQRNVFRRVLESLRPDLPPPSFRHVESIAELLRRNEVGVAAELPDGAQARLEHGCLIISTGDGPLTLPERELAVPGSVRFENAGLAVTAELVPRSELSRTPEEADDETAVFDWDELAPPLTIRGRKQGDRFRPFGMDGTKTVKHFLIDSKVAASFRDAVPLVLDSEGIVWLAGMRRSARAPVDGNTKTVLVLRAESTN
jgi:tRNA(Ile)-lysidine synthase